MGFIIIKMSPMAQYIMLWYLSIQLFVHYFILFSVLHNSVNSIWYRVHDFLIKSPSVKYIKKMHIVCNYIP